MRQPIRCGMFGHRWDLFADNDERGVTIQRCRRCKIGRRLRWNLGKDFWGKYSKRDAN